MARQFRPPKLSKAAVSVANMALPAILRVRGIDKITIDPVSLQRLQELKDQRAMICPNHPTNNEPAVVFELSRRMGQPFHYVCCHEAFGRMGGIWGSIIQRLGAYSLVRGTLDRPSFAMTRRLLVEPKAKLVVFPEGEVYSQNDSLLPFQSGVLQLAFWALEDLEKVDPEAPLFIAPVAIRYRYLVDMMPRIDEALGRLEGAVGLIEQSSLDRYQRIRSIGVAVVGKLEKQYGLSFDPETPLGERMDRIKRMQLEIAADLVGVKLRGQNLAEDMRIVINAVHQVTSEVSQDASAYDRKLWEEQRNHIKPALHELDRLANWIAVYDGYIATNPTQERMIHTIRRMEVEVLGKIWTEGPQECGVRIAEPLDLRGLREDYRADKKATVSAATAEIERRVQSELYELAREQTPSPAPAPAEA